jgi:CHAT domain-containing protein/tetratricopeptide (TPR) repeat protein
MRLVRNISRRDRNRRFVGNSLRLLAVLLMVMSITALLYTPSCADPQRPTSGFEKLQTKVNDSASRGIKPEDSLQITLTGGDAHSQPVELSAGQYLHVTIVQRAIDVTIILLGPKSESLIRVNDNDLMYGSESLSWVAKRSGTYHIQISSVNKKAAPGAYEVMADVPRPAEPKDEARVAAQWHLVTANRYYQARKLHQALDQYSKARELWQEVGEHAREAATINNIGDIFYDMGETQRAIAQYNEALSISQSVNDRFEETKSLNGLGWSYSDLGENQAALNYYQQALSISRALGDRQGQAVAHKNIGTYYSVLGESQKALDSLTQALSISRDIGDSRSEVSTLLGLGQVYRFLNEGRIALDFLKQALSRNRELNDSRLNIYILSALGDVYRSLGDTQNELATLDKAVRQNKLFGDQRGLARCLYDLGDRYTSLGERTKALNYYQRALSINRQVEDRREQAKLLYSIGVSLRDSGQEQQALKVLRQTLSLSRAISDREIEASTLHLLAQLSREQGDLHESLNLIQSALEITDSMRYAIGSPGLRASYFASIQMYYEFYIDLLMQLDRLHPGEGFAAVALQASERSRARSLSEVLTGARIADRENVWTGSVPRETSTLTIKEIQEQIVDRDTILLEYSLGTEHSFLWAVTPDSVTTYELPGRSQLETSARRVYQQITTRDPLLTEGFTGDGASAAAAEKSYWAEAGNLSRMLLGPVAEQLGKKRLLIVSQGALQYIPFDALPAPTLSAEGEYYPLVLDHEIIYLPSASVLALLRREAVNRDSASKTIAVLADPVFDEDDPRVANSLTIGQQSSSIKTDQAIPRLPASLWEAEKILASTPANKGLVVTGFAANRDLVMSGELDHYRIIHFATHGINNSEHPEQSGIMLSSVDMQGQRRNGILQLRDIYSLKLSADLVVLSGCETGLGKYVTGEGIVGLTYSFMSAGAESVVTSLWKVEDSATADLMARFYQGMLRDGLSPSAALREAKMQMWRQGRWRHPYYWAAFTLQGEGDRILSRPAKETRRDFVPYILLLLPIGITFIGVGLRHRSNKSNGKLKLTCRSKRLADRSPRTARVIPRTGYGELTPGAYTFRDRSQG